MDELDDGIAEFCFDPAQERAVSALRRWVEVMEEAVKPPLARTRGEGPAEREWHPTRRVR